MRRPTIRLVLLLVSSALALFACEKEKKKEESTTATSPSPGPAPAPEAAPAPAPAAAAQAGTLGIATFAEAGLSSSLVPETTASVTGSGPGITPAEAGTIGIALTAGKRSFEACSARKLVTQSLNIMRGVARTLCYFEEAGDKIKLGVQYKIPGVLGPTAFWVDTTKNDKLDVYVCAVNGSFRQRISVDAVKSRKSRGSFNTEFKLGSFSYDASGRFNGGGESGGRQRLAVEAILADSKLGYDSLLQSTLNLKPNGISLIAGSLTLTHKKGWAYRSVAAKIGQNFGQAFVYDALEHEGQRNVFSAEKAYNGVFDNAGRVLVKNDVKFFRDGERLDVDAADMPKPLLESFKVPEIDYGWDCVAEEDVVIDTAERASCDEKFKEQKEEDCDKTELYERAEEQALSQDKLAPTDEAAYEYTDALDAPDTGTTDAAKDLAP